MKTLKLTMLLSFLFVINTIAQSDYELYRQKKDAEKQRPDTVYVTDTVFVEKQETVINNYYENDERPYRYRYFYTPIYVYRPYYTYDWYSYDLFYSSYYVSYYTPYYRPYYRPYYNSHHHHSYYSHNNYVKPKVYEPIRSHNDRVRPTYYSKPVNTSTVHNRPSTYTRQNYGSSNGNRVVYNRPNQERMQSQNRTQTNTNQRSYSTSQTTRSYSQGNQTQQRSSYSSGNSYRSSSGSRPSGSSGQSPRSNSPSRR
jgi:hypothetical protein